MFRKKAIILLTIFGFLAAIFLAIAVLMVWLWKSIGGPPTLSILQPSDGYSLLSGQGVILVAQGESKRSIQRVQLRLNNTPIKEGLVSVPENGHFVAIFPWFSSQVGRQVLSVVAYDDLNRASLPKQINVNVIANPTLTSTFSTNETTASEQTPTEEGGEAMQPSGDHSEYGGTGDIPASDQEHLGEGQPQEEGDIFSSEGSGADAEGIEMATPEDAPPQITTFETPFTRQGDSVVVNFSVQAVDDLAIDRLEVILASLDLSGESSPFTTFCPGERVCLFNQSSELGQGLWLFAAQAYDAAGQASQIKMRVFQVLDDPGGQGVAVVVGEEELLPEPLPDDQLALIQGDEPLSLDSLVALLSQEIEEEPIQNEPVASLGDEGCLGLEALQSPEGVLLRIQTHCAYGAPEGRYIFIQVNRRAGNFLSLRLLEPGYQLFNPTPRMRLQAGEIIEGLDENASACNMTFEYTIQIGHAAYFPDADYYDLLGFQNLGSSASIRIDTPPCQAGSIEEAITLSAEEAPEGVRVTWEFAEEGDWVNQLPESPEVVSMIVSRHNPERDTSDLLDEISKFKIRDELPGKLFEGVDENIRLLCGEAVNYILSIEGQTIVYAGNRLYAQKSVSAPQIQCPTDTLRQYDLTIEPRWVWTVDGNSLNAVVQLSIPPGFTWPEKFSTLYITLKHRSEEYPSRISSVNITAPSQQAGVRIWKSIGPEEGITCGGVEHLFSMELEGLDYGRVFPWISPLCPSPPAKLLSLHATRQGSGRAGVEIRWEPTAPRENIEAQVEKFEISRFGDLPNENRRWEIPADQTLFVDTEVYRGRVYTYFIRSCITQIRSNVCGKESNWMNIRMPESLGQALDIWSFDYDQGR